MSSLKLYFDSEWTEFSQEAAERLLPSVRSARHYPVLVTVGQNRKDPTPRKTAGLRFLASDKIFLVAKERLPELIVCCTKVINGEDAVFELGMRLSNVMAT